MQQAQNRYEDLMRCMVVFYRPKSLQECKNIIRVAAKVAIESPRLNAEETMQEIAGQAMTFCEFHGKAITLGAYEFAKFFYEKIFVEMCNGERAILQSRMDRVGGACYEAYRATVRPYSEQSVSENEVEEKGDR